MWDEKMLYGGACIWCFAKDRELYTVERNQAVKTLSKVYGVKEIWKHARGLASARGTTSYNSIRVEREFVIRPSCAAFGKRIPQWSEKRYYAPCHKGSERSDLREVEKLAFAVYSLCLRDGHGIRDAISPLAEFIPLKRKHPENCEFCYRCHVICMHGRAFWQSEAKNVTIVHEYLEFSEIPWIFLYVDTAFDLYRIYFRKYFFSILFPYFKNDDKKNMIFELLP